MTIRSQSASVPLCPLVAREAEFRTLLQLWRSSRLVTLFGQSGVGKSALAQVAAAALAGEFPGRVRSVDAHDVGSGSAVLRLLVRVRRRATEEGPLVSGAAPPKDTPHAPSERARGLSPFFILLDGLPVFAHAAARGLLQWLVANPDVHLLVVSRRPLELLGEQVLPLAPLALSTECGTLSPAATFFEHYARRAQPGGRSADPVVADDLCRALDGFPAALEAAAGLLGTLPDQEIVRLAREQPLSLVLRGRPLQAFLAATWSDLPGEARDYLVAQVGGATEFSGETTADAAAPERAAAVASRLLQFGLLRIYRADPRPHYVMSPLIQAWINVSGAAHTPERQERRARSLLGRAERGTARGEHLPALRWAWRWLAGQRDAAALLRFARALAGPLRHEWGEPGEARELLESALIAAQSAGSEEAATFESRLAAAEARLGRLDTAEARLRGLLGRELTTAARASVLLRLAGVSADRGRSGDALEGRLAAVSLLRAATGPLGEMATELGLAWALWGVAEDQRRLRNERAAEPALEESRAIFERVDCVSGRAAVLASLALLHAGRGEIEEAQWHLRESQALAERGGDRPGYARSVQCYGRLIGGEESERGLVFLEEAAGLWEAQDRPSDRAAALLDLAELAAVAGSPERASTAARGALQLARRHGFRAIEARALLTMAECCVRSGRLEAAESYAAEAWQIGRQTDDPIVRERCAQWERATGGGGDGETGRRDEGTTERPTGSESALDSAGSPPPPVSPSPRLPLSSSPRRPLAVPPLLIRLLGPFTVEGPGGLLAVARLRPKEQRILARLALQPGQVVPRDELLELFWPHSPIDGAERSLRTVVSSLRGALKVVQTGGSLRLISGRLDGYCLETEACAVDADLFARAVHAARTAAAGARPPAAVLTEWHRAYEWYRGDLLGAFIYEDWCLTARERLRDEFQDALFQLARAALDQGSPDDARGLASRMVEIDSTEERAHRLLMRCYGLLGRPAEAVRQFERCRAALWEELGARPAPSTVGLLDTIRAGAAFSEQEAEAADQPAGNRGALFL